MEMKFSAVENFSSFEKKSVFIFLEDNNNEYLYNCEYNEFKKKWK